jgi:hypothetical protein
VNLRIVKLLLVNKADINAMDNANKSVKEYARDCDNLVIKQLIIK